MSHILHNLGKGITTSSEHQTREYAEEFASVFPTDRMLALSGDLGSGKSTFVRGLATAWGITQSVTSPTYNLYHLYQGNRQLVHFDAYRLEDPTQADALMIEEFLHSPWCLAIEWPEKIISWLPQDTCWLNFTILENGQHYIKLRNPASL